MATRALRSRNTLATARSNSNQENEGAAENQPMFRRKNLSTAKTTTSLGVRGQRTALGDINNQKSTADSAGVSKPVIKPSTRLAQRVTRSSTASTTSNKNGTENTANQKTRQLPLRRTTSSRTGTALQAKQPPKPLIRQSSACHEPDIKPSMAKRSNSEPEFTEATLAKEETPMMVGSSDDDAALYLTDDKTADLRPHNYVTQMVHDIDEIDREDPFMVSEYAVDIYDYMRFLEQQQSIGSAYLSTSSTITSRMRCILIDWLSQVHIRFHLLQETMYLTVALVDRFLASVPDVSKDQLQLIGITCMFIASKYEEIYAPELEDFVYITDHTYTKQQVLAMEITVLHCLNFQLGRPLALNFLRRFSKANSSSQDLHMLSKYLLEVQMTDYSQCHVAPSQQAAAALRLAMCIANQSADDQHWNSTLQYHSKYSHEELVPVMVLMCRHLIKTHSKHCKQTVSLLMTELCEVEAVRGKYETQKYGRVAHADCLKPAAVHNVLSVLEPNQL